ncbi:hypothetical protein HEP81_01594 [Streptomyces griseofuscus]|uniref:Uncharacterized protein n=1 Tax=Streptomyces griseofuscus TaxID=146922 RepID=A0A7H1PV43_9ACTN|nr:hypothetical protein HEP81_01594 [Streptomyces griseofuscus]
MTSSTRRLGRCDLVRERSLLCTARDLHQHQSAVRPSSWVRSRFARAAELIARRLHAIQQDLDTTAARLARPRAAAPAAPRRPAHRSP